MESKNEVIKKLINKMTLESLVLESLKHEDLTEEFINQFVEVMKNAYNTNISTLKSLINSKKENGGENGK